MTTAKPPANAPEQTLEQWRRNVRFWHELGACMNRAQEAYAVNRHDPVKWWNYRWSQLSEEEKQKACEKPRRPATPEEKEWDLRCRIIYAAIHAKW